MKELSPEIDKIMEEIKKESWLSYKQTEPAIDVIDVERILRKHLQQKPTENKTEIKVIDPTDTEPGYILAREKTDPESDWKPIHEYYTNYKGPTEVGADNKPNKIIDWVYTDNTMVNAMYNTGPRKDYEATMQRVLDILNGEESIDKKS